MEFTAFPKPCVVVVPSVQQSYGAEIQPLPAMARRKPRSRRISTSIVLAMKLTIVLLTAAFLHVQAAVVAQSVSLSGRNIPVKKVLQTIKQQTGYVAFYNQEMLADAKSVSLDVRDLPLADVLNLISRDQPFLFEIKENTKTIVLSPKPETVTLAYRFPVVTMFMPITGRITDSTGTALIGASVLVQGKKKNAITDAQGRFQIDAEPGDVLLVSYIGYKSNTFTVKSDTKTITVVLTPTVSAVSDVVVTGIFTKSKQSFTGASKLITQKELQQFQGRNIFVTISNIDPSFYIVPNNNLGANPNAIPDVQIRGTRNLPNIDQLQGSTAAALNTPLIILDGFPTTLQRMMDLNNNEIATITLLKDGSATALYGSQGANGVIVITTRQPVGGKLRLSYRGTATVNMPDLSSYNLLNAREKLQLENASGYYSNPTKSASQNLLMEQYYNQILGIVESGVNTDWMSKPLRTGVDQSHSLRLEGGDNVFRYALEGQFNKLSGVMKGSGRETANGTITLSYRLNKLNFQNSLLIGNTKSDESPWGSFSSYAALNPYWSPYDANGNVVQSFQPFSYDYWVQSQKGVKPYANPMYDATLNTFTKSQYTTITNNFQVEWRPIAHLMLNGGIGINGVMSSSDDFKPASHSAFSQYSDADIFRKGSYGYSSGRNFDYTGRVSANYYNLFNGVHGLTVGLSADIQEVKNRSYSFLAEGFPDESLDFLGMAFQYQKDGAPSGTEGTSRRVGVVSSLNYIYNDRYFVDLTYRMDGASQFGKNSRFAPFYAVGGGWNLQNEHFIQDNFQFIDRLKLRASYGITGNQNFNAYQALSTYSYVTSDRYKNWIGAFQRSLGNPDLKWQNTGKLNIGIETDMFHNRISIQADVYKEKTSNLLSSLELPYSNGFTSYVENIGSVEQRGWELMAKVAIIDNSAKRLFWSVTGNIAYNEDKITKLSEAMKAANEKAALAYDYTANSPNQIIREGTSQYTIYAVPSLGIDPSTGKELYLNKDGEVTYTWRNVDRVAVGVARPKYVGTANTLFRYGGFSMNAAFRFNFGGQLYNETLIAKIENADRFLNVDKRVFYDRWQKPGDKVGFRGLNETLRVNPSSRFVQDESTLVCSSLYFGYDVTNKELLRRIGMQALSVSVSSGDLFYTSTIRQERGTDYPFTRQVLFTVFTTF